ncbi:hypothetical protein C9E81_15495 [Paracoccus alkanivorans]|uniref:Uncharacterized protein n=1 Tax=Paracoccus alkanivorans TaxID=2116655 RepID=A0A3M0M883_9RHOB|nr:hypothetical protein C9E81_15495 [Paracoccus alkanivorans]
MRCLVELGAAVIRRLLVEGSLKRSLHIGYRGTSCSFHGRFGPEPARAESVTGRSYFTRVNQVERHASCWRFPVIVSRIRHANGRLRAAGTIPDY